MAMIRDEVTKATDALLDGRTKPQQVVNTLPPGHLLGVLEMFKIFADDDDAGPAGAAAIHYELVCSVLDLRGRRLRAFIKAAKAEDRARDQSFTNWVLRCHHITKKQVAERNAKLDAVRALLSEWAMRREWAKRATSTKH